MSRRTLMVTVALVCGAGLWLRLTGLGFGLPAVFNMDEVAIMNRALAFGTGDLNPKNFLYPTFYFYALFVWEALTFIVGWTLGSWDSLSAFQREFFVDPSRFYWSGRLLTTLCGVATIAAVARLTARLFNRPAAVAAAICLAGAPIAVMDAHYVKHDVPVTLLVVLTHLSLVRILMADGPARQRDVWWTGALAGLSMSTHYYAVFVTLPIAAVLLSQPGTPWSRRASHLVQAGLVAALVFLAASPFLLPNIGIAWLDITQNRAIVMDRATDAAGRFASLGRYLDLLVRDGLGWPGAVAGMAGLLLVVIENRRQGLFLLLFPASFFLFITNTVPASRYLNAVLPFLAIGAGFALSRALRALGPRPAASLTSVVALSLVIAAPGCLKSVRTGRFLEQADTRTLAQAWVEEHLPEGTSILVQPYSVPLRQSRDGLIEALRHTQGSEELASIRFRLQLALIPYPAPAYRTIYLGIGGLDADKVYDSPRDFDAAQTLEPLRTLAVHYVVLKRYNAPDASLASLDRALANGGHIVATFSPYRSNIDPGRRAAAAPFLHNTDARLDPALERPGPVIEIWRID